MIQAVVPQVRYRVARQGWHRWAGPKPHCCERSDWLPVTYTNRKGITSYLCRSVTKTGRSRYFFAHEPRGEPVEEIPEGYKIGESANGLVFLKKDRPAQILPAEVAAVEEAVKRHPKSPNYRVSVKHDRIEIHERIGPDAEELTRFLEQRGSGSPGLDDRLHAEWERRARFMPVLRFILADAEQRTFRVERMHYGGRNEWFEIQATGPVGQLVVQLIPKLGTHALFELF